MDSWWRAGSCAHLDFRNTLDPWLLCLFSPFLNRCACSIYPKPYPPCGENSRLLGSKVHMCPDPELYLRKHIWLQLAWFRGQDLMSQLEKGAGGGYEYNLHVVGTSLTIQIKVHIVKAMVFPVVTYRCESWTIKKAECRKIVVFKLWCWKTLESPLDSKEIKLVNPKGNQPWIFTGRTDAEAEAPILWPPDEKSWLIRKDPDDEKYWGQREKGVTEDKMVGWHYWHNGHAFEQTLGDSEAQRSLACCSSWGWKKSDTTFLITWTHE